MLHSTPAHQSEGLNSRLCGNEAWQLRSLTDRLKVEKESTWLHTAFHSCLVSCQMLLFFLCLFSLTAVEQLSHWRLSGERPRWDVTATLFQKQTFWSAHLIPVSRCTPRAADFETDRICFCTWDWRLQEAPCWTECEYRGYVAQM